MRDLFLLFQSALRIDLVKRSFHARVRAFEAQISLNRSLTYKIDFNLCIFEHNRALMEVENVQLFLSIAKDKNSQPMDAS